MKKNLLALTLVIMAGCASVPATKIAFNPVSKQLTIQSPKDVELSNLVATINTAGECKIEVGTYVSKNNAEVLAAVAAGNASTMKLVGDLTSKLADTAITATGKAVKP